MLDSCSNYVEHCRPQQRDPWQRCNKYRAQCRCVLVFEKCPVRIAAGPPNLLSEVFCFPPPLVHANVGVVLILRPLPLPCTPVSIRYSLILPFQTLRSQQLHRSSRSSQHFMETDGSFLCTQGIPLIHIQCQIILIHSLASCFFKIHFNIPHQRPDLPSDLIS